MPPGVAGFHFVASEFLQVSDVFNEVDEELRRDQVNKVFRKFLPLIITVMVLVVGGVAGYQSWTWWDAKQKAEAAETFGQANALLEAGQLEAALSAYEAFAASGPKGYAALSKMQAAVASMKLGRSVEAARLYREAAEAFDDPLFADLANLKAVLAVSDQLSLNDLDVRLGPLAGAGRPFRALAREMLAAKAMAEGDLVRARDEYTLLSLSLDVPAGAQQRAQMALSLLGPAPKPIIVETEVTPDPVVEVSDDAKVEETNP
ncbi:MAG: hypothetical protein COA47_03400 [Robiginitomaculum sp.]|nr:MAG: hypothetical protein COA47_03400 [Robiginitomaculum sp.]